MGIMSVLASSSELSFKELKQTLNMTDGNLSVHIKNLQKAGYLSVSKSFIANKPYTACRLTELGRAAFGDYIRVLESIIKSVKGSNS